MHHEPAVRQAQDPHALPIGDAHANDPVHHEQLIGRVGIAPRAVDRAGERLPVARGSARVRPHDVEPGVGEREHLQPGRRTVSSARPAVHVHDERRLPASPRPQQPSLDGVPVAMPYLHVLRHAPERSEPAAPVRRDPAEGAVLDGVDLTGVRVDVGDDRHASLRCGERRAHDVALGQRCAGSVDVEPMREAPTLVRSRAPRPFVRRPRPGARRRPSWCRPDPRTSRGPRFDRPCRRPAGGARRVPPGTAPAAPSRVDPPDRSRRPRGRPAPMPSPTRRRRARPAGAPSRSSARRSTEPTRPGGAPRSPGPGGCPP